MNPRSRGVWGVRATMSTVRVIDALRAFARDSDVPEDGELVRRFVERRDEAAFAELLHRHGPVVFGVCRRVLGHVHDAEDAFQAVWLVFAKRAADVSPAHQVGPFLYGVAVRTATNARTLAMKRRLRAMAAAKPESIEDAPPDADLRAVLDEEVARLPEKYRAAVVLCDVFGKSRSQAAAELGWPEGTVADRVRQGRERLAVRLRQRGVVLSALGVSATVPPALASETLAAVFGSPAISPSILFLVDGAMRTTSATKVALGLFVGLILTGVPLAMAFDRAGSLPPVPHVEKVTALEPISAPVPATDSKSLPPGAVMRLGNATFRHASQSSAVITRDGTQLITVSAQTKTIKVWDLLAGTILREMSFSATGYIHDGFAWSPDGKTFATLQGARFAQRGSGQLVVHDAMTGNSIRTIPVSNYSYPGKQPIRYLPNGKRVAVQLQGALAVFDVETGKELASYAYEGRSYGEFAVSPDGKRVAVIGTYDAAVWDWETNVVKSWKHPAPQRISQPVFSPDGHNLALLNDSGGPVSLVEADTGKLVREFRHPTKFRWFDSVIFSPNGTSLLVNDDGGVQFSEGRGPAAILEFERSTGKLLKEWPAPGSVRGLVLTTDRKTLISNSLGYPRWDVATGQRTNADDPTAGVLVEAVRAGRGTIITRGSHQPWQQWDEKTGRIVRTLDARETGEFLAFANDPRTVVTGSQDDKLRIWDLETGNPKLNLPGHGGINGVRAMTFTPDDSHLISFGLDFYLRTTNLKTGKAVREFALRPPGFPIPEGTIDNVMRNSRELLPFLFTRPTFDARGTTLAIIHFKAYYLYDTGSGRLVRTINVPRTGYGGLLFNPTGTLGYTLDVSPTVETVLPNGRKEHREAKSNPLRGWNLKTGQMTWEVSVANGFATKHALSPDGNWLAFPGKEDGEKNSIEFHASANGAFAGRIKELPGDVYDLTFSADGKRVIVALSDGTALVYPVPALTPVVP